MWGGGRQQGNTACQGTQCWAASQQLAVAWGCDGQEAGVAKVICGLGADRGTSDRRVRPDGTLALAQWQCRVVTEAGVLLNCMCTGLVQAGVSKVEEHLLSCVTWAGGA